MSGHKNTPKSPVAEWKVFFKDAGHATESIRPSRMAFDGERYVFTDGEGVVAAFAADSVLHVKRVARVADPDAEAESAG